MGGLSIWHWLIVGIAILLLFGKGRFSDMMGDVAHGLKSFKKGMSEEDDDLPPRRVGDASTASKASGRPIDIKVEPQTVDRDVEPLA